MQEPWTCLDCIEDFNKLKEIELEKLDESRWMKFFNRVTKSKARVLDKKMLTEFMDQIQTDYVNNPKESHELPKAIFNNLQNYYHQRLWLSHGQLVLIILLQLILSFSVKSREVVFYHQVIQAMDSGQDITALGTYHQFEVCYMFMLIFDCLIVIHLFLINQQKITWKLMHKKHSMLGIELEWQGSIFSYAKNYLKAY